jgi:hypothetical protein
MACARRFEQPEHFLLESVVVMGYGHIVFRVVEDSGAGG